MALSDLDLTAAASAGDHGAFGLLARKATPVVRDLLRRMGAPWGTAEDITHDALIAAWRAIGSYRGEAAFTSWCMKIAARLYLKRRKRDARLILTAEPLDPADPAPSTERATQANLDLDRALARLSAPERLCVTLCHGAGLTGEEIAARLGLPLGTVKSHVTRGLQKLRRLMTSGEDRHG